MRSYLFTLARLVTQDEPDAGPIALCGQVELIDSCARLLLGRGDRRALAPLTRPLIGQLRRCSAIVACNLAPQAARQVAAAHRPWVALVDRDVDRYAYACLPRLGARNVVFVGEDGSVPDTLRDRLVAVLDAGQAGVQARRLPPLRAPLRRRLEYEAVRDAALAGFARAGTTTLLAAIARPILTEARAGGADRTRLYAAAATAAAATAAGAGRTATLIQAVR